MLDERLRRLGAGFRSPWPSKGQPVVLVFARGWGDPSRAVLDGIRSELRGLGATLLVVGQEELFCFRPDDELEIVGQVSGLDDELLELLSRFDLTLGALAGDQLTLGLLDGDGKVRLRRTVDATEGIPEALLEALRAAGKRVAESASLPRTLLKRREVVVLSLVGALALVAGEGCKRESSAPPAPKVTPRAPHEVRVTLQVNGKPHDLTLEPRVSLLDALRERLGLTGTKKGCDHGQCGACTVLVGGRSMNACLILAVMVGDEPITTIEGMAEGERLHPLQTAFITEDALQCGYCTPGQIMSAAALLKEKRAQTDDEVREHMSGNICRCGAYANIVKAIQSARKAMPT